MTGVARIELRPDYEITRVIRGGWQLAGGHGTIDREAAIDDLVAAFDAGVTTFDCADIYTGVEELIGAFRARLADLRGPTREADKVHTKFVPDLAALALRHSLCRARSSIARCAACASNGSTSCSSTGGTTRRRA